uniref:Spermatogenesis associated 17 n=1 Tax=Canis lupus familiaris TaxID=9615 RepID=A0A8C0PEY9_CANLF
HTPQRLPSRTRVGARPTSGSCDPRITTPPPSSPGPAASGHHSLPSSPTPGAASLTSCSRRLELRSAGARRPRTLTTPRSLASRLRPENRPQLPRHQPPPAALQHFERSFRKPTGGGNRKSGATITCPPPPRACLPGPPRFNSQKTESFPLRRNVLRFRPRVLHAGNGVGNKSGESEKWNATPPRDEVCGSVRLPWRRRVTAGPAARARGHGHAGSAASSGDVLGASVLLQEQIQRRWRGYRIRKYCFNYFYLKEYLRAVSETNDAIREALEEFAEMKEREEKKADLEREEKKRDYQARKMHYLLSTKQIPGIYNSPFRKDPDPWELRLQKAKPLTCHRPKVKQKRYISLSSWLACTSARSFPRSEILPPIDRKRCQGPFRDITEVLEQRYKPLEPTLRVAEPIDELKVAREELRRQEWMRNVNDNMFLPFSSHHKNKKYIPLMHSSSKYGPNSYGSQHFRDENPRKWICDKDFQTVLPSFDLFSKYGKSYSKAGQII